MHESSSVLFFICHHTMFLDEFTKRKSRILRARACGTVLAYILRSVFIYIWYGMRQCSTAAGTWKQPREGNINCGLPEVCGVRALTVYDCIELSRILDMASVSISHKDITSISHHSFSAKQWSHSNTFLSLLCKDRVRHCADGTNFFYEQDSRLLIVSLPRGCMGATNSVNYENQRDSTIKCNSG